MFRKLVLLVGLVLAATVASPAQAARPSLDPEVRLHAGASIVQGPGPVGMMVGLDSRLTRFIYVDIAGFVSPFGLERLDLGDEATSRDYMRLRHSVHMLPGFRIPHRQPKDFAWDLVVRGGTGVAWAANLAPINLQTTPNHTPSVQMDVTAIAGLDAMIRKDHYGLRLTGRVLGFSPFYETTGADVFFWATQFGVEAVYQF
jgi:hypothetical protein